jgi:hypothetical protein
MKSSCHSRFHIEDSILLADPIRIHDGTAQSDGVIHFLE